MAKRRSKKAEARARKKAGKTKKASGKSKYGKKLALQVKGRFNANSPFEAGEATPICAVVSKVVVPAHDEMWVDFEGERHVRHVPERTVDVVCTLDPKHKDNHCDVAEELTWPQAEAVVEEAA